MKAMEEIEERDIGINEGAEKRGEIEGRNEGTKTGRRTGARKETIQVPH